jgi:hypothetical protein
MTEPDKDIEAFLRGILKKHGTGETLVVKHRNSSGKLRKHTGAFLGLRGGELGLRNAAWSGDKWLAIGAITDVWKHGGR